MRQPSQPGRTATTRAGDHGSQRAFVLGRELRATILTTGTETAGRHDLTLAVTPPGGTTPLHLHLGPGDFFAIPQHTPHAVQTGPQGARSLHISSPAGFAALIVRTGTPAHLATAATELGGVVLGPPGTRPADQ